MCVVKALGSTCTGCVPCVYVSRQQRTHLHHSCKANSNPYPLPLTTTLTHPSYSVPAIYPHTILLHPTGPTPTHPNPSHPNHPTTNYPAPPHSTPSAVHKYHQYQLIRIANQLTLLPCQWHLGVSVPVYMLFVCVRMYICLFLFSTAMM